MEYSPGDKVWKLAGRKDHIKSMAVLLNVINQCARACEMEDSWRVRNSSHREQLRPRQSYDVSFILSVWCLASSLLRAPSLSLSFCLSLGTYGLPWRLWWSPALSITHSSAAAWGLHNSMMHSPTMSFKFRTKSTINRVSCRIGASSCWTRRVKFLQFPRKGHFLF